jgi:hypothetical protein
MEMPITVTLDECNLDLAVKTAMYEAKKAVAEYDSNVAHVRKSKINTTTYDITFKSLVINIDDLGCNAFTYLFIVT